MEKKEFFFCYKLKISALLAAEPFEKSVFFFKLA